jgi:hypothetical protein
MGFDKYMVINKSPLGDLCAKKSLIKILDLKKQLNISEYSGQKKRSAFTRAGNDNRYWG